MFVIHGGNATALGDSTRRPTRPHRIGVPFRDGVYGRYPDWLPCSWSELSGGAFLHPTATFPTCTLLVYGMSKLCKWNIMISVSPVDLQFFLRSVYQCNDLETVP